MRRRRRLRRRSVATGTAQPQVIAMALPGGSAIGQETDPTYGLIGGYTQSIYSQVLAFAPNSQVMIANGQIGVPHTLDVVSQTAFSSGKTEWHAPHCRS